MMDLIAGKQEYGNILRIVTRGKMELVFEEILHLKEMAMVSKLGRSAELLAFSVIAQWQCDPNQDSTQNGNTSGVKIDNCARGSLREI